MPEGDSYVHAARAVRPVLEGAVVTGVDGSSPSVRRYSARLLDRTVTAIRTHGKHLLIDFDSGYSVHVHLGMNGSVRVLPAGPVRAGSARVALGTEHGVVTVSRTREVEADRTPALDARALGPLGPDLIAEEFDWDEFGRRAARADGTASAADFLLDQRIMAGVGNVYKNEVLFVERIAPTAVLGTLDAAVRRRLAERSRELLRANRGPGKRVTTGDPRRPHWVYERAGRPCRHCGSVIRQASFGSPQPRVTFWCPSCQSADVSAASP